MDSQKSFSPVKLKCKNGVPLGGPAKCDECQKVKPEVKEFSKSNRQYRVHICSDCEPKVLARSFPHCRPDNSRDDDWIAYENFDNDDLEISDEDAMGHTLPGGYGSNGKKQ